MVLTSALVLVTPSAVALHTLEKQANAASLASPGLLVIDPTENRVLVANAPESMRVPASVLKLLTTTVALFHLGSDARYSTSIWSTPTESEYLIRGSWDPFLTSNTVTAKKYGARYLPSLIPQSDEGGKRNITIYYQALFPKDLYGLGIALKQKKIRATFIKVTKETASQLGVSELNSITSKPLSTMVAHTILWSDNLVADRLANAALRSLELSSTPKNLTTTFKEVLASLGVYHDGLVIRDGSGLSKKNRLSARTVVELLVRIRGDERFASIYEGLPVSGETGTLSNRFERAPLAVGHVHAKTGWVNNSVTMAGYVESGDKEYVFAILADGITPTLKSRDAARRKMDKLLESIVTGDQ